MKVQHEKNVRWLSQKSIGGSTTLDDEEGQTDQVRQKIEIFLNYLHEKQNEHRVESNSNKTRPTKETKIEKISSDIIDKYGGLRKPIKSPDKRKQRKSREKLCHSSQMIHLHDEIRRSINDDHRFPTMPMCHSDLGPTIEALQSIREKFDNSSKFLDREKFDKLKKVDRQVSDEGYRSVGFDSALISSPSFYRRSKSDQSNDKVHRWLFNNPQVPDIQQLFLSGETNPSSETISNANKQNNLLFISTNETVKDKINV